jgi:hypothetical protein
MDFPNSGKTWLNDELRALEERFNQGMQIEELCRLHGRRPYAVVGKLQQMGLLVQRGLYNYYRVNPDPWIMGAVLKQLHDHWVEGTPPGTIPD